MKQDVAIGMAKHLNPFDRGGLVFTIISRLPEEVVNKVYAEDKDHHLMLQVAEKTGLRGLLEKKGKRYYALSPRWKKKKKR